MAMAIAHGARTLVVRQMTDAERLTGQARMAVLEVENARFKSARAQRWDMRALGWDGYDFGWRVVGDDVEYARVG